MKNLQASKNRRKISVFTMVSAACLFLFFSGCQNPLLQRDAPDTNTGNISLTIATGAGRAIMPNITAEDISAIVAYFTPVDADGGVLGNTLEFDFYLDNYGAASADISLGVGLWNLAVYAYQGDEPDRTAVLRGLRAGIDVGEDVISISIILAPFCNDALYEGTFEWELTLPVEAHFVRVEVRNVAGDVLVAYAEGTPAVTGDAQVWGGEIDLPVGDYRVVFTLLKEGGAYYLEFWQYLLIYANLTSLFEREFEAPVWLPAPQLPEFQLATGTVRGTIGVTWSLAANAVSHEVRFGLTDALEDAQHWTTDVTVTGTTIADLYDAARYYVWVRAVNRLGFSSGWVRNDQATMVPAPSISVYSFDADTGELVVEWTLLNNPVTDGITYELSIDIASNFENAEVIDQLDAYTHTLAVTSGFTYFVRVRVDTPVGESAWSAAVSRAKPLPLGVRMPVITQDAQDASMRVEVTVGWDHIPGVLEYEIWHTAIDNVIPTLARRRDLAVQFTGPIDLALPAILLPGRFHNTSVYWKWTRFRTERGWSPEHMVAIPTGTIKLNVNTGEPIFNYIYIELNQTDPRVALSYRLGNVPGGTGETGAIAAIADRNAGRPLFDAVILFAANLRDRDCVAERAAWEAANPGRPFRNHDCNQTGIHLHFNGNHAFLYGGGMTMPGLVDTFVRPIQAEGIRVMMGLLPDWGGFSFTTLGEWIFEDIAPVAGPGHPHLGPQTAGRCNRGAAPPANWVDAAGNPYYRFGPAARRALIDQIGQHIERLGLDGVDLDCEWANAGGEQYQTLWWGSGWCGECGASHPRWNYYSTAQVPVASGGVVPHVYVEVGGQQVLAFGDATGTTTRNVMWPANNRWGHPAGSNVIAAQATASSTWRNNLKAENAMHFIAEMRYVLNGIQQRTGRRQMITVYEYGWMGLMHISANVVCPRSGVTHRLGDLIDYSTQAFYGSWVADSRLARAQGTAAQGSGLGQALGAVLYNNRYMYSPMAIDLGHGHDTAVRPTWAAIETQARQLRDGGYGLVFMYGLLERQRYHTPAVVSPANPAYGQDEHGNHRRHRPTFFGGVAGRNPEDYLTRFTNIVWGQPTVFTGTCFPMSWLEFSNDRPWVP